MSRKQPQKTRPLRIERLSPPELTSPEIDIYLVAMAEGMVCALEDYPALLTDAEPILQLATTACQETDARRRAVYIESYKGGYVGFRVAAEVDPIKVHDQAATTKKWTREQQCLFYLEKSAANLGRIYSL